MLKPLATACVPFCSPSETTPTFLKQMSVPVTDTFDCTSCAGYGNYQLQSCCANLGSTQTSCLDCGTCSRGYAADTFPYGYSSHSFLCLLYFFFFFFYYCWTRVFSKFCKWLRPNRLRSQFFHLVHFSDISHMHACVNVSISAFLYVYVVVVQAHMKFLLAKQK